MAKRKFNKIPRSKSTTDPILNPGYLVQVFIQNAHEKRRKLLSPRIISQIDQSAGTVTIPGSNGHKITAAFEDSRHAITHDDFATSIVKLIDNLDEAISDALDENLKNETSFKPDNTSVTNVFDAYFDDINSGAHRNNNNNN